MSETTHFLAIDTHRPDQTVWTGVQVDLERGEIRAVDPVLQVGRNAHDRVLAVGVDRWLNEHEGWRDDLAAVAVLTGPGGFTGLRIGVAFATGLAMALGIPVLPVATSRLLAALAPGQVVWAVHRAGGDAVRGQVVCHGTDKYEELTEVREFVPGELTGENDPVLVEVLSHGPVIPLGQGYERHQAALDRLLIRPGAHGTREERGVNDLTVMGEALARAAGMAWRDGLAGSPLEVDVDYGAEFMPTPKPRG